jgi:hypothetical protein
VPGAGFSPEAVPGNSAETKNTRTVSEFFGNRSWTRVLSERNHVTDARTNRSKQDNYCKKTHNDGCQSETNYVGSKVNTWPSHMIYPEPRPKL